MNRKQRMALDAAIEHARLNRHKDELYSDAYEDGFQAARDLILLEIWCNKAHTYCDFFYEGKRDLHQLTEEEKLEISYDK